jgi:HSP20 family molecular chaperone IbpA
MSTPARSFRNSPSLAKPEILSGSDKSRFLDEFYNLVSNRAYSLFEEFGRVDGHDVSHWLQAEKELASLPQIEESEDTFSATVPVTGILVEQIKVCATDDQAIVSAKSDTTRESPDSTREMHSIYYMVRWPERVSADSVKAEIRDGKLTVTARKDQGGTESVPEFAPEKDNTSRPSKAAS